MYEGDKREVSGGGKAGKLRGSPAYTCSLREDETAKGGYFHKLSKTSREFFSRNSYNFVQSYLQAGVVTSEAFR